MMSIMMLKELEAKFIGVVELGAVDIEKVVGLSTL
jgi:hypothetical protein